MKNIKIRATQNVEDEHLKLFDEIIPEGIPAMVGLGKQDGSNRRSSLFRPFCASTKTEWNGTSITGLKISIV
jgi:hypothetical protein